MNVKEVVGLMYNINQIFKQVFNSNEAFSNKWCIQDGRMVLNHPDQLPSLVEIIVDPDTLLNAKGLDTAKSQAYREFNEIIKNKNLTIDSVGFFNLFKTIKKSEVTSILIDKNLEIEGNILNIKFDKVKCPLLNKDKNSLIGSFILDKDTINTINSLDSGEVFNLVLDFDNNKVYNGSSEGLESFIDVKLTNKFMPYIDSITNNKGCEVKLDIYESLDDYIYDIIFTVKRYKINAKGQQKFIPIYIKYGFRILER